MAVKGQKSTPQDRISISPDLPPKLRQLKTEVLNMRKNVSNDNKKRSKVRHLKSWPFVELTVGDRKQHAKITEDDIIKDLLGFSDFSVPSLIVPDLDIDDHSEPPPLVADPDSSFTEDN